MGEDRVSPSRVKESGVEVAIGLGLAAGLVGSGEAVRRGVPGGEVFGGKARVVASTGRVGVAVNSVTMGTAVGGISAGEQPVKRMTASQIMARNGNQVLFSIVVSAKTDEHIPFQDKNLSSGRGEAGRSIIYLLREYPFDLPRPYEQK